MNVLPVIARELRASARQPFTYYVRALGATALLLASLLFGAYRGFEIGLGRQLFGALHCTLFCAIWLLVPMLTADCISRERREGTLGLLFLTPLKGTDIVVAKGLAQGLRSLTLGLAVVPVLGIPFLLGGVSRTEALMSVVINANAMSWALAAGLLASAWSKVWLRALVAAAFLVVAFVLILSTAAGWFVLQAYGGGFSSQPFSIWDQVLQYGIDFLIDARGEWAAYTRGASVSRLFWALGEGTVFSLMALVTAVLAAGAKTRRSWQEEPPSRRRIWWQQTFCTPVLWLAFFRPWMRRKLERNPIGWLEQRTWSGRLVTWAWFAVLISIYSTVLTYRSSFDDTNAVQETIAWLLAGSMAMSAAGSFRRERETGVLELLLVSPLGENQIISGRLRGLWGQFLPAVGLLLAVWIFFSTFLPHACNAGAFMYAAVSFLTVPVFGLYFSLRCRHFITAFLATVTIGLLLPIVLSEVLAAVQWAYGYSYSEFPWILRPSWGGAVCQGLLAVFCWVRLFLRLKHRTFPLERTER